MRLDQYSNPIFSEQDLFDALYNGHNLSLSDTLLVEHRSQEIQNLETQLGFKFLEPNTDGNPLAAHDQACQSMWFMPDEYKTLDIEAWIWQQTPPWDPQHSRVAAELAEFKLRNMMNLLRWLKYFVDSCRSNQVVWGVGRGSSVASYVLFLIGVHRIDSIKYNLDWQEFLR